MKKTGLPKKKLKHFTLKEVVVCDFDGVISKDDVCDRIMEKFGSSKWVHIGKEHDNGYISHSKMNEEFVAILNGKPQDISNFIKKNIKIRDGFFKFLAICKRYNILPIIVSGGWDFYIKVVLKDLNLFFVKSEKDLLNIPKNVIPIICNRIIFDKKRSCWRIKKSTFDGEFGCSPDKKHIINYLRNNNVKNIMVIGDGSSDFSASQAADFVFATGRLNQYCNRKAIKHMNFNSFEDINQEILKIKKNTIRVLSLPSYHPYNTRFDNYREIVFVNPSCDFFVNKKFCSPKYLDKHFPLESYDIVHIHFEYYLVPFKTLKFLIQYFIHNGKPIVWTCHDRNSLVDEKNDNRYIKFLYDNTDAVITLTPGCAKWLYSKFGHHRSRVTVIPMGYLAHPSIIDEEMSNVKKDKNLFTIHIGDFRKNKDYISAIKDFLACPYLANAKIQLIYSSINFFKNDKFIQKQKSVFYKLISHNSRIVKVCSRSISNNVFNKAFLASHAVILPYKWGTHSGQLELARDCGVYVIASNVGFYKEQWPGIYEWNVTDGKYNQYSNRYQKMLIKVYNKKPLKPAGLWRKNEFDKIIRDHVNVYRKLIDAKAKT